ncbi:MAG: hypothetical protein D6722_08520 [Bacteroidetes bacterium]|nr:MAG: hypothetical protein D6722_08520 [Bacteroidota bacterium]
MNMPVILGMALFVGCGIMAALVLPHALAKYRTDIPPGTSPYQGRSIFKQWNYANPANYTPEGRQRLKWLYICTVLQMLGVLLLMTGIVGRG